MHVFPDNNYAISNNIVNNNTVDIIEKNNIPLQTRRTVQTLCENMQINFFQTINYDCDYMKKSRLSTYCIKQFFTCNKKHVYQKYPTLYDYRDRVV